MSTNGHAVDIYAGCLDQIGLLEMKSLCNATNGFMILADSFAMAIFKQSFLRTLQAGEDGNLKMGFNATFDVQVRFVPRSYSSSLLGLTYPLSTAFTDHQGAQDLGSHWPRHLGQQEGSLRRRDRNWNRSDVGLEGLLAHK